MVRYQVSTMVEFSFVTLVFRGVAQGIGIIDSCKFNYRAMVTLVSNLITCHMHQEFVVKCIGIMIDCSSGVELYIRF